MGGTGFERNRDDGRRPRGRMMMKTAALAAVGLVGCALASGCSGALEGSARAVTSSGPFVQANRVDDLSAALAEHMTFVMPEGEGPFPVVLQFHGCGGLEGPQGQRQPIMDEYAQAAASVGVAAVIVDSFAHRGITRAEALERVCKGRLLRGVERASDVLAALDHVRGLETIDGERIALAGWSHGGWAVMDLLSMDLERRRPGGLRDVPQDGMAGVVGAYLTYPYAGFFSRTKEVGWATPVTARFVMAGEDEVADSVTMKEAIAEAFKSGAAIEVVAYEGATHGFDERYQEADSSAVFDEALAARARADYADWLRGLLVERDYAAGGDELMIFAQRTETVSAQLVSFTESDLGAVVLDAGETVSNYVVALGDTLWGISSRLLGAGARYPAIYDANTDIIEDPDLIFPGQVLDVPQQG